MTPAQITGQLGERYAKRYLEKLGYQIMATNWRHQRAEIDLIAKEEEILVFVEVKTRRSTAYGTPASSFTRPQAKRISAAAGAYMESINYDWEIRFDIIEIVLEETGDYQLAHLKDAYFPGLMEW